MLSSGPIFTDSATSGRAVREVCSGLVVTGEGRGRGDAEAKLGGGVSGVASGRRIVSGFRPTGRLHLGHLHGALRNWLRLQHEAECFFFVADWHALTTGYEDTSGIGPSTRDMVIDWLAAGLDPARAVIFLQSAVKQHAELHLFCL